MPTDLLLNTLLFTITEFKPVFELGTVLCFSWVIWEVIKLVAFFWHDKSELARLKTNEFFTDGLLATVTVLMGVFLFIDWTTGIDLLVAVRPLVGVLNALALRRLYEHFRSM